MIPSQEIRKVLQQAPDKVGEEGRVRFFWSSRRSSRIKRMV